MPELGRCGGLHAKPEQSRVMVGRYETMKVARQHFEEFLNQTQVR
jgi:hypothetical protein